MRHAFNSLPRSVRERLVALSNDPKDPRVLIAQPESSGAWFKYVTLVLGLGGAAFALKFLAERYADNIGAYHDKEVFLGLAGALFVVFASVATIVIAKLFPPPPYKTGQWALKSCLLRLESGFVDVKPLSEIGKPTIVTVLRNGAYSGSRLQLDGGFQFFFGSKADVETHCALVLAWRDSFSKALAAKDARTLAEVDVFSECTLSGNWAASGSLEQNEGPLSTAVPTMFRWVQWLGSLIAGAGFSYALYAVLIALHHKAG